MFEERRAEPTGDEFALRPRRPGGSEVAPSAHCGTSSPEATILVRLVSTTPHRRNPLRLIIQKETQLYILWLVAAGVFVCMIATAALVTWISPRIWAAVVLLAMGLLVALWVSRKITGPLYRIERDIEALLNGAERERPIRLREGDPMQHLAELINRLRERLQAKEH
jgi:Flp pilus assembly protein TadB